MAVGVEPFGVDVATRAAEIAGRRGVTVAQTDLADAPASFENFALMTALDVIEHVADPAELLKNAASRLAPDGLVYFETPNWRSTVFRLGDRLARIGGSRPRGIFERLFPPEHVQYFTPAGIRALVERTPLQTLHMTSRRLPFGDVAGGTLVKAATGMAQLPDRAQGQAILLCVLLGHRSAAV
jgi:2-polyprenyl-6-hydroxyphenyl methylase/3-demethylubiquinone-9 3-methyltransferase